MSNVIGTEKMKFRKLVEDGKSLIRKDPQLRADIRKYGLVQGFDMSIKRSDEKIKKLSTQIRLCSIGIGLGVILLIWSGTMFFIELGEILNK